MLSDLLFLALTAPSLPLTWLKFISPIVALMTLDQNRGHLVNYDHIYASIVAFSLAAHSLHNLHAVVADALGAVSELPEGDLAAVARLLGLWAWSLHRRRRSLMLLLTSLFNCLAEGGAFIIASGSCASITTGRLSVIVLRTIICAGILGHRLHLLGVEFLARVRVHACTLCCNLSEVGSVNWL